MYPDNKCWIKAIINHHWWFTNTINITSYCWVSIFKPGSANKRPKCYLLHCEAEAVFIHLPRDVLHKSLLLSATNIDISTEQGRNSIHTKNRGEICPCRRRQCKIFASGVNFSTKQHVCIYAIEAWVKSVANYAFYWCTILGLKIRMCKKLDKYHVWQRRSALVIWGSACLSSKPFKYFQL